MGLNVSQIRALGGGWASQLGNGISHLKNEVLSYFPHFFIEES